MTDWAKFEERLTQIEEALENHPANDPEIAAIDDQIRKAFRGLLALGWAAKWVVYMLAALAGALTAWGQIREGIEGWLRSLSS